MSEHRLNQRQIAVMRGLSSEAQQAQAASNAAQGKLQAFLEVVKAQFDIPAEVETVTFSEDGTVSWSTPIPPVQAHAISDGGDDPPLALVQPVEKVQAADAADAG